MGDRYDNPDDVQSADLAEYRLERLGAEPVDPGIGEDCAQCGEEITTIPYRDSEQIKYMGFGGASIFCNEDCAINAAEDAHERMLEKWYGGAQWP